MIKMFNYGNQKRVSGVGSMMTQKERQYTDNVVVVGSNPAIRHNQNNHWPQPWPVLRTKCRAHMVTLSFIMINYYKDLV